MAALEREWGASVQSLKKANVNGNKYSRAMDSLNALKSQFRKFLGSLRYRKPANRRCASANCKSKNFMINPQIANPQISTKFCTIVHCYKKSSIFLGSYRNFSVLSAE
jgi:hypothetical protein